MTDSSHTYFEIKNLVENDEHHEFRNLICNMLELDDFSERIHDLEIQVRNLTAQVPANMEADGERHKKINDRLDKLEKQLWQPSEQPDLMHRDVKIPPLGTPIFTEEFLPIRDTTKETFPSLVAKVITYEKRMEEKDKEIDRLREVVRRQARELSELNGRIASLVTKRNDDDKDYSLYADDEDI